MERARVYKYSNKQKRQGSARKMEANGRLMNQEVKDLIYPSVTTIIAETCFHGCWRSSLVQILPSAMELHEQMTKY